MNGHKEKRCRICGKLILVPRKDSLFLRNKGIIFGKNLPGKGQILCKNCGALNTMDIDLKF